MPASPRTLFWLNSNERQRTVRRRVVLDNDRGEFDPGRHGPDVDRRHRDRHDGDCLGQRFSQRLQHQRRRDNLRFAEHGCRQRNHDRPQRGGQCRHRRRSILDPVALTDRRWARLAASDDQRRRKPDHRRDVSGSNSLYDAIGFGAVTGSVRSPAPGQNGRATPGIRSPWVHRGRFPSPTAARFNRHKPQATAASSWRTARCRSTVRASQRPEPSAGRKRAF